jgi:hypothetical protein
MSAMGEMPMPDGWTMSMTWMPMCGLTWPGAAACAGTISIEALRRWEMHVIFARNEESIAGHMEIEVICNDHWHGREVDAVRRASDWVP